MPQFGAPGPGLRLCRREPRRGRQRLNQIARSSPIPLLGDPLGTSLFCRTRLRCETLSATAERSASPSALGERVRQLRIARGLTQTGLAAERFSKEYVSQIERGRVRPSPQTLDWLAQQLEVSRQYLETGVSSEEAERAAGRVVRAEAAVDADRHEEALECLEGVSAAVAGWNPELQLRALVAEAAARIMLGELEASMSLLASARLLAEGPEFTDVDRARVLFHLGALPLQALVDRDGGRALHRGARARPPGHAGGRPARLRRPAVALALLPAPARLARGARGRGAGARARAVARRPADARELVLPGLDHRRAQRPVDPRPLARRAREGALRAGGRPAQRRAAAQQPRRPQLPARQARRRGRSAEAGRVGRARGRIGRRRGAGDLLARPGAPEDRRARRGRRSRRATRSSCSTGAPTSSRRSATPSSSSGGRCSSRAGSTRRRRRSARQRRVSRS